MQHCHIAHWHDAMAYSVPGRQGCCSGQPPYRTPHMENTVQLLVSLLDVYHRWNARELVTEVEICHKTVLHILHDILGYRKFAARSIPHEISKVQQWYQWEGVYFLGRISL